MAASRLGYSQIPHPGVGANQVEVAMGTGPRSPVGADSASLLPLALIAVTLSAHPCDSLAALLSATFPPTPPGARPPSSLVGTTAPYCPGLPTFTRNP